MSNDGISSPKQNKLLCKGHLSFFEASFMYLMKQTMGNKLKNIINSAMFDDILNLLSCIRELNQASADNEGMQRSMRQVNIYGTSE